MLLFCSCSLIDNLLSGFFDLFDNRFLRYFARLFLLLGLRLYIQDMCFLFTGFYLQMQFFMVAIVIVCIGVSNPQKHPSFFFAKPPLKSSNCPKPASPLFLGYSLPINWFFVNPPKNRIFQWTSIILGFFILNTILSFKSN